MCERDYTYLKMWAHVLFKYEFVYDVCLWKPIQLEENETDEII